MLTQHAYLHGKPESSGLLRSQISDFKVFEQLPFLPCGEGEHLFVHIRKTGANTLFVARELAKYFEVKEQLISYAGLKDRFAVTEQWFGVHVPGKQEYNLDDLDIEGVEVLSYKRHNKKLRTGALTGNRFELILRDVTAVKAFTERWQKIVDNGVPNYFGEQRFGIGGGNIERALALFSGQKVKDKKKRGIYLSAARSHIFNSALNERIQQHCFDTVAVGDVLMLAGTQSVFHLDTLDDTIKQRFIDKDIDITAPMWGAGELMTSHEPLMLEQKIAQDHQEFCQGLPRFGLKQERRRIRLTVSETDIELLSTKEGSSQESSSKESVNAIRIKFFLPAGCYATTILRELLAYQDMTLRVDKRETGVEPKLTMSDVNNG
ncbi:tRNA pseudouridine(13) synthase TruD [Colwellia psychrerythraea]|uniref:tRNA pseudouridine synthase D n=1 Tax=Colwellia psychrerythraea TaxID=28229 RepID=A0A099KKX9_COLPS|nr:tRNA pseudouridine(13) synthase TruD [Colwellia psychrerythraea]KGJ90577.1 tRNA pseudouridine synthase D [Colwellia psychrerythraea]